MISSRLFAAIVLLTAFGASFAILPRLAETPPAATRIDLTLFEAAVAEGEKKWGVGDIDGMTQIAPPPGSDIHMLAGRYEWRPALKLTAGGRYRLHLTSEDLLHGLLVPSLGWRFEAAPGYEQLFDVTAPKTPGSHVLLCDEFCGDGHHLMTTRIEVVAAGE